MRRLVHISDVHFGRSDPVIVAAVLRQVTRLQPHLVAMSGDLTQRAREWQFRAARAFLDALPCPRIVVPGNHDVPLYDVARRFLDPLGRYMRFVTGDLRPVYDDSEMIVVGLNTTRSLTIKDGTIRSSDLRHACRVLEGAGDLVTRIVVAHHPFEYPEDSSPGRQKARAIRALEALARAGTDVFLTGHLHVSYANHSAARYRIAGRTAVVVEAGTATSTRRRGEANCFNLMHIDHGTIVVERWCWRSAASSFGVAASHVFERSPAGWLARTPEPPAADVGAALAAGRAPGGPVRS
jgi:3',5'-cyclic AMP phosphodiesterase CpdA